MDDTQAPAGYDSWAPPPGKAHPMFAYDNLPSNLLVYDNAPPPGHKRWEHDCADENANDQCGNDGGTDAENFNQLPLESCEEQHKDNPSIIDETIDFITKSCSDIEESLSTTNSVDLRSPSRVKFAEDAGYKAPLALPELTEDLGGSTTTDGDAGVEGSSSASGLTPGSNSDKLIVGEERASPRTRSSNSAMGCSLQFQGATPDNPPPSAWASESKIYEKFHPNGEIQELRRYSTSVSGRSESPEEIPSIKEQETQADDASASSGDCSENCSCSDRNSPEKEEGAVTCLVEQCPPRKTKMRLIKTSSYSTQNRGTSISPLDESAEWQKINDIMQSFGGGICRESVFSERYEPNVAVFLHNRQSAALTLTMGEGNYSYSNSCVRGPGNSKIVLSPTSGLSQISKWLKGLGIKSWAELARNFELNGFERIELLQDCVNRAVLSNHLNVHNQAIQDRILESLSSLPEFPENAKLNAHKYISDWLLSLGCQDYLGNFMKVGLDSVHKISVETWDENKLRQVGIQPVGHIMRILTSITITKQEDVSPTDQDVSSMWSSTGISTTDFEENSALTASGDSSSGIPVVSAGAKGPTATRDIP